MTVQELFKSLDREDFIKYYCQYEAIAAGKYQIADEGKESITNLFDTLCTAEPVKDENFADSILFSVPELGSQCLHSFLVREYDLMNPADDGFVEHYGYEFTPMLEVLGYKVSDSCILYFDDIRQLAASILYEMTFFGYTLDSQESESSNLLAELNEQTEEIQRALDSDEPVGKSFDEFLSDIGWVDERSDVETEFETAFSEIEGTTGIQLREKLYELERYYINKV